LKKLIIDGKMGVSMNVRRESTLEIHIVYNYGGFALYLGKRLNAWRGGATVCKHFQENTHIDNLKF